MNNLGKSPLVPNAIGLGLLASHKKILEVFFPICVYVKQVTHGAGLFLTTEL